MTGDMANATSAPENGRAQLDTLARLALCAALVEYDTDVTGRLAEHSAIFAPYRNGTSIEDINHVDYQEAYQGRYSMQMDDEAQGSAVQLSWATGSRPLSIAGNAAPTLFSDFLGAGAATPSNDGAETTRPLSRAEELDDSDLASEWGIETVMSKFDNGNYDPSSVKPKKARPRKSFAQSEVLGPSLATPMMIDSRDMVENLDLLESRSAPGRLPGFTSNKTKGKKAKSSLETELELAFKSESDGDALSHAGGRSRASSFGMNAPSLFDFQGSTDRAEQSSAAYAREAVARPDSRMSLDFERGLLPPPANFGMEDNEDSPSNDNHSPVPEESGSAGYVSRFDPKAIAAAQAEHTSSRLRFPDSLHPKILIMPAPLADLLHEDGNRDASPTVSEKAAQAQEEAKKAHIEREAGKLYGKSLMDELVSRKMRMKAKTRTFQGDSRRAMMDNPVSQANRERLKRAPSPLSGKMEGGEDDDEDKPLTVLAQQKLHSPVALLVPKPEKDDGRDPWAKYASRTSLAALAADEQLPVSPSKSLLSPEGLTPPGQSGSFRQSMSTKELQQQYKHSRYLSTMSLQAIANPPVAPEESDSDDDVPLDTRRTNLAEKALQSPQGKGKTHGEVQAEQPVASVFGQDLVMARELKKLEEILKIEEAEKKIEAEKQRIRNAEKEAKDRKKREKMEKKQKKKGKKDKETQATVPSHIIVDSSQQERAAGSRISALHPDANGIYPDFPPGLEEDQHMRDEQEELWPDQQASNRFSALPLPGEDADIMSPSGAARPRSSSIAPSLDLNFLTSTKNFRLDNTEGDNSAKDSLGDWFGEKDDKSNGSQHSASDEDEEDRPVRSASRLGLAHFGHDEEEDDRREVDEDAGKRRTAKFARMPELRTPSRADSFSGVLESFGINEGGSDSGSETSGHRQSKQAHRASDSDSEDEETQPISKVIARRSAAWQNNKVAFEAPKLELGEDFGLTEQEEPTTTNPAKGSKCNDGDDSDATSVESAHSSDEEDDTPLGIQRVKANMAARAADHAEDSDSSDDDVPLALREDDDRPLGQAHPTAVIAQQMEQQQMHNMTLVQQMQMQYQNQMAMQYQAMQQVAALQSQLGMQEGYVHAPPPPMSVMGSTVGLNLPPDPKLLNSVDRWRQNIA